MIGLCCCFANMIKVSKKSFEGKVTNVSSIFLTTSIWGNMKCISWHKLIAPVGTFCALVFRKLNFDLK